jgi:hypothetical protein
VGAVDHHHEALRAGARDDLLDRQHEPRARGDVADVDDSGVLGGSGEDCVGDLARVGERQRDRRPDVARAGALTGPLPREVTGAVLEVGREHLVAGPEVERTGSEVDAGRGVRDEGEVVGGAADVVRESCSRRVEEGRQAAVEKVDGLALELALPRLVALEDRPRARAEGAVVEERDLGVEEELAAELLGGQRGHGCLLLHPKPPPTRGQVKRVAPTVASVFRLRH